MTRGKVVSVLRWIAAIPIGAGLGIALSFYGSPYLRMLAWTFVFTYVASLVVPSHRRQAGVVFGLLSIVPIVVIAGPFLASVLLSMLGAFLGYVAVVATEAVSEKERIAIKASQSTGEGEKKDEGEDE